MHDGRGAERVAVQFFSRSEDIWMQSNKRNFKY